MDIQEYYVRLDVEIEDEDVTSYEMLAQGITSDPFTILCNMPDIAVKHKAFGENVRNSGGIQVKDVHVCPGGKAFGRLTCDGQSDVHFRIIPIRRI